jgi:hypothetical protein
VDSSGLVRKRRRPLTRSFCSGCSGWLLVLGWLRPGTFGY